MNEEEKYRLTLYIDLTYFLMKELLNENPEKEKMVGHILDTWETRNNKLIKHTFDEQAKQIAEENKNVSVDEVSILLSTQGLVFNSIRKDLVKVLKKGIIESFNLETNP